MTVSCVFAHLAFYHFINFHILHLSYKRFFSLRLLKIILNISHSLNYRFTSISNALFKIIKILGKKLLRLLQQEKGQRIDVSALKSYIKSNSDNCPSGSFSKSTAEKKLSTVVDADFFLSAIGFAIIFKVALSAVATSDLSKVLNRPRC